MNPGGGWLPAESDAGGCVYGGSAGHGQMALPLGKAHQEAQLTIGKFSDAGHGACGFEVGLRLHQACPVSHMFSWPSSFAL